MPWCRGRRLVRGKSTSVTTQYLITWQRARTDGRDHAVLAGGDGYDAALVERFGATD